MITENMYLLAKQVVSEYEQQNEPPEMMKRSYTYDDIVKTWHAGVEYGTYIGLVLCHQALVAEPLTFEQFMDKNYNLKKPAKNERKDVSFGDICKCKNGYYGRYIGNDHVLYRLNGGGNESSLLFVDHFDCKAGGFERTALLLPTDEQLEKYK